MRKLLSIITTAIALVLSISLHANNEHTYTLAKGDKLTNTFSADINDDTSMHLIIFKNKKTKKFGIQPLLNQKDSMTELQRFEFDSEPSIASYHTNDDIITFLITRKDRYLDPDKKVIRHRTELTTLDYNLKTNTFEQSIDEFDKDSSVIRLDHSTRLITQKDSAIFISKITNSKISKNQTFIIQKENTEKLKEIFSSNLQYVDQRIYVKNGSITNASIFYDNEQLYFSLLNEENKELDLMKLNLNDTTDISFKSFKIDIKAEHKLKNINSYLFKDRLFFFYGDRKDMYFYTLDIENNKPSTTLSFKNDLSEHISELFMDELHRKVKNNKEYRATVTVNESKEDNLIIRFDAVYYSTYSYHDHFWFHQQFMMQNQMMMQQNMMNNIPGFGPSPESYDKLVFKDIINLNVGVDIVVDPSNIEVIKNGSKTRKKVDQKGFVKSFKKNKDRKEVSIAFLKDTYRTFWYSKKQKQFILTNHSY